MSPNFYGSINIKQAEKIRNVIETKVSELLDSPSHFCILSADIVFIIS